MAIDDTGKIDMVVTDKGKTCVRLMIADHLDWEEFDEGDHLMVLQHDQHLRACDRKWAARGKESGQLAENRPTWRALLSQFPLPPNIDPVTKQRSSTGWLQSLSPTQAVHWKWKCRAPVPK